jgi:hypothetical protein
LLFRVSTFAVSVVTLAFCAKLSFVKLSFSFWSAVYMKIKEFVYLVLLIIQSLLSVCF